MRASEASSKARPRRPAAAGASPPVERFRLCGPTHPLDPRTHALRRDVADVALAGIVFAPHYAAALIRTCAASAAMMRAEPSDGARAVSQLLHGERFAVIDASGGWTWGYSLHDNYVGYVAADALVTEGNLTVTEDNEGGGQSAEYRISVQQAPLFSTSDIKSPVLGSWPMGARFTAQRHQSFLQTTSGFIHVHHATPADQRDDPAAVATRLVGQPYLWGGRGAGGVDCSGLVQLALAAGGIAAPRDSDLQRSLGHAVGEGEPLRRGDLIFFPGHVGMMADDTRLIHATAHWMATVIEPLADVVARLQAAGEADPVLARRRIEA